MPDLHTASLRVRRLFRRYRRPVAAVLAAGAVLAILQAVAPAAPPTRPVVAAAHDLDSGTVLASGDLTVEQMPPALVPAGSSASFARLLGRVVAGPVRVGDVVTDERLLGPGLLEGYPPGTVAAPVRLADASVVSLLDVGEQVDVYAVVSDNGGGGGRADRVVADVPVVALPAAGDDAARGGLVVLGVSSAQAAALAQASATAPVSVVLRR